MAETRAETQLNPGAKSIGKKECAISQESLAVAAVDKEGLARAVKLNNKPVPENFACVKQLLPEEISLNFIKLEELGDIQIPVSLLDIERLKQISKDASYGKGFNSYLDPLVRKAMQIESSKIISTAPENINLLSHILRLLDLPTELMEVEAKLDQMILYETGGHYRHLLESKKETGTFGTATLQIPVEGGHEGGHLKVEYKGRKQIFESYENSDRNYFLETYYKSCQHMMEPVTRGFKLTMVFNLVWKNANTAELPQDFPAFLIALKEIKQALTPWIPKQENDNLINVKLQVDNNSLIAPSKSQVNEVSVVSKEDIANTEQETTVKSTVTTPFDESDDHLRNSDPSSPHPSEDNATDESNDVEKLMPCLLDDHSYHQPIPINEERAGASGTATTGINHLLEDISNDESMPSDNLSDEDEESSEETENEKINEDKALFFVLQEKYEENDLAFHRLRGKDRVLANVLQCCLFLEVHLAMVEHTVNNFDDDNYCGCFEVEEPRTEILHWINSTNVKSSLNLMLDWEKQCVGPLRNLLTSDGIGPDKTTVLSNKDCDCDYRSQWERETTWEENHFYHSILVIWPKQESVKMYCQYGFHSLLDHMEISLNSTCTEQARKIATQDLKKIISFCSEEPAKVWMQHSRKKGELTHRLFRLCNALEAREEGVTLLKTIGSDFGPPLARVDGEYFEGIQTEQVANAIAEFECYVAGWSVCAEPIRQIISSSRICKQFVPVTKLAKCLLNVKCFEGAMMVADCISSSLVNMDQCVAARLTQSDIELYIDLITSLEANAKTSNPDRLIVFTAFFPKLNSSLQCHLVLDLEAQGNSRLKGIESCQFMFQDICKALTDCDLHEPALSISGGTMIVDIFNCYVRLGNAELLQLITSNICRKPTLPPHPFNSSKNDILGCLISSPTILELATASELGRSAVASLVDAQLFLVSDQLSARKEKPQYAWNSRQQEQVLLVSLCACLRLIMILGKHSAPEHLRLSPISQSLVKLNVEQLSHVLIEVLKSSSERLKKLPSSVNMIRELCDLFFLRFKDPAGCLQLPRETILETLNCFIEIGDEALIQRYLEQTFVMIQFWDANSKFKLFTEFVSSSHIWAKLDSAFKLIVLNACSTIVESEISSVCQRVGSSNELNALELKSKISVCIQLFFLAEKNRISPEQKNVTNAFQPLFDKLSTPLIMDLVFELHKSESMKRPNIKKYPTCLDFYLALCRSFCNRDFVAIVRLKKDAPLNFIHVLLWLGDDECWQSFAGKICGAFSSPATNIILRVFVNNIPIQKALVDSLPAFTAFERIVNYWIAKWETLKTPVFSLQQLRAKLPGHPDVENFLRSPSESFTYANFSSIADARRFAQDLHKVGPTKGFGVSVRAYGTGKSARCDIVKNRSYYDYILERFAADKKQCAQFAELLANLSQERTKAKQMAEIVASTSATPDEVCIVSPPKRIKLDIPLIELD